MDAEKEGKDGRNVVDPYVEIVLGKKGVIWTSKVMPEVTNPVWNETFVIRDVDIYRNKYVQFNVRDANGTFTRDVHIGTVDFFLESLVARRIRLLRKKDIDPSDPTWDRRFDIKPSSKLRDKFPKRIDFGKLHLRIDVNINAALHRKFAQDRHKRIAVNMLAESQLRKDSVIAKRHSGWLFKEVSGVLGVKEKSRFFEFHPPVLRYFTDDYQASPDENAEQEMLRGSIDLDRELIMIRPHTLMFGHANDPCSFEILVCRQKKSVLNNNEIRTYKLRADSKESAAKWVHVLVTYCEKAMVSLINGHIKTIKIVGERRLQNNPQERKHTSYTIRVEKTEQRSRKVQWFERYCRYSQFKGVLKPRVKCLFSSAGLNENRLNPKFPSNHKFSNLLTQKIDVIEERIVNLQNYVDILLDLAKKNPAKKWWWLMRLLVQFFAPKWASVPILRKMRHIVEDAHIIDYRKVKQALIGEFGDGTYQQYRLEIHSFFQKCNRLEALPKNLGTLRSTTTDIESMENKLAFLDYVSNPFKILHTIGNVPDNLLTSSQRYKSTLKEFANCKFQGTLMKTSMSKRKETWERRWCRIPKEGGVLRRSDTHPFSPSFWDMTKRSKDINLKHAQITMGRTLWSEEVEKSGKIGSLRWPPTPYWFKLIQPNKSRGNNTWYFCTSSKVKLTEWVEVLQEEIYESSSRGVNVHISDDDDDSATTKTEPLALTERTSVIEERAFQASCDRLASLIVHARKMKTVNEAIQTLDNIIKEWFVSFCFSLSRSLFSP